MYAVAIAWDSLPFSPLQSPLLLFTRPSLNSPFGSQAKCHSLGTLLTIPLSGWLELPNEKLWKRKGAVVLRGTAASRWPWVSEAGCTFWVLLESHLHWGCRLRGLIGASQGSLGELLKTTPHLRGLSSSWGCPPAFTASAFQPCANLWFPELNPFLLGAEWFVDSFMLL